MTKLTDLDKIRWRRQLHIPQFGEESQHRLKESTIVLFGVGGVGCSAAIYLAVAGIGGMVLVDYDNVELHNLNRQILYGDHDLGKSKVQIAAERLYSLNPSLNLEVVNKKVDKEQIDTIVQKC